MIGERIGPYRIVELLGRGGLSEVYRAYHQEEAQDVALKILQRAPDSQTRTRFAREAEALKALEHPHIIEILTVGEYLERPYYTMPFVRVRSLQEVMLRRIQEDGGRFSQDEILRVMLDLARALDYAHANGVLHRDVKPGNILLDPQFRPTLCDFGLARLAGAESVTRQGTMVGTPRYMAPEQLQGRRCDGRTDLYSLGLVAYEMAAGEIPFDSPESMSSAVRRLSESIPPIHERAPQLSPELAGCISQLLEANPTARPQKASEVVALLEALPGAPPPVGPGAPEPSEGPTPELVPGPDPVPAPRRSWVPAALGALVLLGGLAWTLGPGGSAAPLPVQCRVEPFRDHAILTLEAGEPVHLGVRFGFPGRLAGFQEAPGPARSHRMVLEGLTPDREYAFSLTLRREGGASHEEALRRFHTALD